MHILFVAAFVPMPDRQADMLRLFEILKIGTVEHALTLVTAWESHQRITYGAEVVMAYRRGIEALGIRVYEERDAPFESLKVDVVIFEYYRMAQIRLERMRLRYPAAIMIIDTVDIVYRRLASRALALGAKNPSEESIRVKGEELATYALADLVIAISEDERELLKSDLPQTRFHVIPLVFNLPPLSPRRASAAKLLFVGNFNYSANVDAIREFIETVLPRVREIVPDTMLTVIGNDPPSDVATDSERGIDVKGFVADIRPYYLNADISVAPVRWGGGLKGKVAEAMAYGLPVVTTTTGASGFNLVSGVHALVADTPQDMAAAIIELHTNPGLLDAIGRSGRGLVESQYSIPVVSAAVKDLFSTTRKVEPLRLTWSRRAILRAGIAYHRHIGWRFAARQTATAPVA